MAEANTLNTKAKNTGSFSSLLVSISSRNVGWCKQGVKGCTYAQSYQSPSQNREGLTKKGLRKVTCWNGVKGNSDSKEKTIGTHVVEEERKYAHYHISSNDIFQRVGLPTNWQG